MPAASFPEYARQISDLLDKVVGTGEVVLLDLQVDQRSSLQGYISGSLQFDRGSTLHFREFVSLNLAQPKLMYAYHYQDAEGRLLFRYDNAAHRPPLPQVEHKHLPVSVAPAPAPPLAKVLDEVLSQGGT